MPQRNVQKQKEIPKEIRADEQLKIKNRYANF